MFATVVNGDAGTP